MRSPQIAAVTNMEAALRRGMSSRTTSEEGGRSSGTSRRTSSLAPVAEASALSAVGSGTLGMQSATAAGIQRQCMSDTPTRALGSVRKSSSGSVHPRLAQRALSRASLPTSDSGSSADLYAAFAAADGRASEPVRRPSMRSISAYESSAASEGATSAAANTYASFGAPFSFADSFLAAGPRVQPAAPRRDTEPVGTGAQEKPVPSSFASSFLAAGPRVDAAPPTPPPRPDQKPRQAPQRRAAPPSPFAGSAEQESGAQDPPAHEVARLPRRRSQLSLKGSCESIDEHSVLPSQPFADVPLPFLQSLARLNVQVALGEV